MSPLDSLLHPVRFRILRVLLGHREQTVKELARAMPDVPTSGLYRHVSALVEAGVLAVASERPVRGTVERTYVLASPQPGTDEESLSNADHTRHFAMFTAGLLGEFERYAEAKGADPGRETSYWMMSLWLSDAELSSFGEELSRLLTRYLELGPGVGRRPRLFSTVMLPSVEVEGV